MHTTVYKVKDDVEHLDCAKNLFLKKFIKFIYFWLCWVFVAARRLSLFVARGGYSWLRCVGFSLRWLLFVEEHGL